MQKLLITALAALTLSGALAQETAFPDIPAGHWASEAVARIADLGIVIGFPDGTFRGNESFTRYQAALVVDRLLNVVRQDIDAASALSQQDLEALRNALQELASDVAAQGVQIATIQDNVASNTERIQVLEDLIAGGGLDAAALQDLQNQLDSLRVAVDTAQARAAAAELLASNALAAVEALQDQVAQNTADIAALNRLVALLNEDILGLGAPDVSGLESDIANIREFVILLRRDQVALRDRVAALEGQLARLDDLEERVSDLEDQALTFSGSIGVEYTVSRLSGAEIPFDVDRIFGIGRDREFGVTLNEESGFEQSLFSGDTKDENADDDQLDAGEVDQDREDITGDPGELEPTFTLNLGFAVERESGFAGAFNEFEGNVALKLRKATLIDPDVDVSDPDFSFANPDNFFDGYVFTIEGFQTTFGLIGADPLLFRFGAAPDAEFTPYVFESLGPGFVAFVGTPDFLAFLQPTLTIAYGRYEEEGPDKPEDDNFELPVDDFGPFADAYYRGIRGTLSPFEGLIGGFSYAQLTGNADDNADAAGDNLSITVFGLDAVAELGIFEVRAEYASSSINDDVVFPIEDIEDEEFDPDEDVDGDEVDCITTVDDVDIINPGCTVPADNSTLFYVQVMAGGEDEPLPIPLLESVSANYRSIPQYWVGLKYDEDAYPYDLDQTGFGLQATLQLFFVEVQGFIDSYSVAAGDNVFAFGVNAGVEVYRAIEVFGFYNSAVVNNEAVNDIPGALRRNENYTTGFGLGVRQDGEAENALLPGVNFSLAYNFAGGVASSGLAADLDTVLNLGFLTIAPYLNVETDADPAEASDDTTTFKVGAGIETEPFDFFLQPSLIANVNFRTTSHSDVDPDDVAGTPFAADAAYTATELQFAIGVAFNDFLFENSVAVVRYGVYSGTNISTDFDPPGFGDSATNISEGDVPNDITQTASGYEIGWQYYGLEFSYGAYTSTTPDEDGDVGETGGQAFRIQYEVTF